MRENQDDREARDAAERREQRRPQESQNVAALLEGDRLLGESVNRSLRAQWRDRGPRRFRPTRTRLRSPRPRRACRHVSRRQGCANTASRCMPQFQRRAPRSRTTCDWNRRAKCARPARNRSRKKRRFRSPPRWTAIAEKPACARLSSQNHLTLVLPLGRKLRRSTLLPPWDARIGNQNQRGLR